LTPLFDAIGWAHAIQRRKEAHLSLLHKAENDTGRKWEYDKKGDAVEGVVSAYSIYDGGKYAPAPMVTIEATTLIEGGSKSEPDTVRILCGKTVLKRKIEEHALKVGDKVGIVYKGEVVKKDGDGPEDTYSDFGVAVERGLVAAASSDGADW
jgi:hypothetical protein